MMIVRHIFSSMSTVQTAFDSSSNIDAFLPYAACFSYHFVRKNCHFAIIVNGLIYYTHTKPIIRKHHKEKHSFLECQLYCTCRLF